jgi:hypothetical protein
MQWQAPRAGAPRATPEPGPQPATPGGAGPGTRAGMGSMSTVNASVPPLI